MSWSLKDGALVMEGRVVVPGPVREAIEHNGVIVVLFQFDRIPVGLENANVIGIDARTGIQKWKIPRQDWLEGRANPATALRVKDGVVWLYFWGGLDGSVNIDTGEVTIPPGQRPW